MKFRLLMALAVIVGAILAYRYLPLADLFAGFQPATVALSIMAAAVLVRLNRGMPTLDWKTLEPAGRKRLTGKIVDLQKDYLSLLAINAVLVAILIALVIATPLSTAAWPAWLQKSIASILCGGMILVVARMGIVVWRDYDIVTLQKVLIDAAADKEELDSASAEAQKTISSMRQKMREAPKPTTGEWESE